MIDDQMYKPMLDYLNAGGSREIVNLELLKNNKYGYPLGSTIEMDLTSDGVNEFIVKINRGFGIYSCKNYGYELILNWNGMIGEPASIVDIKDMNRNGVPEVIVGMSYCSGHCFDTSILEWNGQQFQSLIGEWKTIEVSSEEIKDINNDGVYELIVSGPFPSMGSYTAYIPLRGQKDIYFWNGKNYRMSRSEFPLPEYRFQAIQDADMEILDGHFVQALEFYNDVIFNEKLKWWSEVRREYETKLYLDSWDPAKPTPLPEPSEAPAEYPRLAAYAYYRIMLLHIVLGNETDALTTYNTLQQTFGSDPYGHPYVEMATSFWEAHQSTHIMYDGCAAAIQFAVEYPEILTPLGSDYHGAQSHHYKPEDVCPFR